MPSYIVTTNSDTGPGSLSEAITYANANPGTTITFGISNQTITLTAPLPLILGNNTTIDGGTNNITISGNNTYRVFFIGAAGQEAGTYPSTTATIDNLTIIDANAQGGAGGDGGPGPGDNPSNGGGGGGGAGLGGAVFVSSTGSLTLSGVAFSSDAATGGDGGGLSAHGVGGGGGMGGDGGDGGLHGGGGGGGFGNNATGGAGGAGAGGNGAFTDGGPAGAGGAGAGGAAGGGGGGGKAGQAAGGGGVAGTAGITGAGGTGGFGGGGGGGSGAGGFGGGGGGDTGVAGGGNGGFGGGGGGGFSAGVSGLAGFGGGDAGVGTGGSGGAGGGGLGAGGDIFVQQGGALTIDSGSLGLGTVTGGTAGTGATDGHGYGSGLFIDGTQPVTFAPAADQTVTISGVIADITGSSDPSGLTGAGSLIMNGPGELVLAADNTPGASSDLEHAGFSGGITIEDGTVDLTAAGAAGSGAITFQPAMVDQSLEFAEANAPTNEIDGFGIDDDIRIDGFLETSLSYSGGILSLQGTDDAHTPESFTLDIPGLKAANFQPHVGSTDTVIDYVACYCRGTLIATDKGEVAVETLAIGDGVVTASGEVRPIKWIGRRSYGGRFIMGQTDILPICIKADALGNHVPARDLWISPHHAMYLGGVLIEAKDLINGVSIVQTERVERVEYFHIELETHDVIVAEGAMSETFIDDDSRGMFHNAHEYAALYPDNLARPACYCAPRVEDGYEVEAVRQRIAQRAGFVGASDGPRTGELRGYIDLVSAAGIAGWAQNVDHPEAPVCLDIYAGGRLIGQTLANSSRADLAQAKLGSGRHSFAFTPPAGLDFAADTVEVRRSLDGAAVKFSTISRRALQLAVA